MDIYLDANATTPVLAQARHAAIQAMVDDYGNPSSIHSTGLKAKSLIDGVRALARRLLGAGDGQLLFTSGATEGIQTAVLSSLGALRERRERGEAIGSLLLYGATEHKAVPEALKHWNRLLGLGLQVQAIPVGTDGLHDLAWLAEHAADAGLVCTMAANNETGVISDLDGIAATLQAAGSRAFWMVDGVQALGKLPLRLAERRIDYAPFSGHKLYAPKGIGLLYVRPGAPFTPLLAGGGQEGSLRSGTENMSGIAALGAVLAALEDGRTFRSGTQLQRFRDRLAEALLSAFPGLVFNAPLAGSLPTTLNFSVPGLPSRLLLDLFDAADVRVSGGSACSAAQAAPSFVLQAMGLPDWQTASAVRLSFGPAADEAFIAEAVARIAACGLALRRSCLAGPSEDPLASDGVLQLSAGGASSWLLVDGERRQAWVLDPQPEFNERVARLLRCHSLQLTAVLDTREPRLAATARADLLQACDAANLAQLITETDAQGWPGSTEAVYTLAPPASALQLSRLQLPADATHPDGPRAAQPVWLLQREGAPALAFVGSAAEHPALAQLLPAGTLLCSDAPGPAALRRVAITSEAAGEPAISPATLAAFVRSQPGLRLVDVREPYEQLLSDMPALHGAELQALPLSRLADPAQGAPAWLAEPGRPLLFFCRSGGRSQQAAQTLRRLGHPAAWTLEGGLAMWQSQGEPVFMPAI